MCKRRLTGRLDCAVVEVRRLGLSTVTTQCIVFGGKNYTLCSYRGKDAWLRFSIVQCVVQGGHSGLKLVEQKIFHNLAKCWINQTREETSFKTKSHAFIA